MHGSTVTTVPSNPGSGSIAGFAPPLTRTHLSLDRYARILGINPVHFWGAYGEQVWWIDAGCDDAWPRHSWQKVDAFSQEELAYLIHDAENEIAKYIGYPVAPEWIEREVQRYPKFYRPEYGSGGILNTRGEARGISTDWRKITAVGRRAVTLQAEGVVVAYTDDDVDGFFETATVTVATALTDAREIKVYFAGTEADPRWEIRQPRSKTFSGGNIIFKFDSWLLLSPDHRAAYPMPTGWDALNIGDNTTYFVTEVDVYREYTDSTSVSAEFFWEPSSDGFCGSCGGDGCPACGMSIQNACIHVRDHEAGIVVPTPATYDTETGLWGYAPLSEFRSPDQVRFYYQAGNVSQAYIQGRTSDPLDDYWAQAIAMLATARSERPLCGCGNAQTIANHWRTDVAFTGNDTSYLVDFGVLANPFGTKVGELAAWKRVSAFNNRRLEAAVL